MITTNAFILRRYNIRDADRIYTLYTERLGKVEAIATGVRKIKSKLGSHLEPCSVVAVTLVRGRMGWRLVNASREQSFFSIHKDLERFALAMTALETVDALTKQEYPDQRIFTIIKTLFHDAVTKKETASIEPFLYALLSALGYRPLPNSIGPSLFASPLFTDHLHYPLRSVRYRTIDARNAP
ncbi:DNA repair protein RecO [Candidatus Uhrbacteria bacterium]|nr:DNA repair protein RecO [Candidatus Uhrbacteria bacterium]